MKKKKKKKKQVQENQLDIFPPTACGTRFLATIMCYHRPDSLLLGFLEIVDAVEPHSLTQSISATIPAVFLL